MYILMVNLKADLCRLRIFRRYTKDKRVQPLMVFACSSESFRRRGLTPDASRVKGTLFIRTGLPPYNIRNAMTIVIPAKSARIEGILGELKALLFSIIVIAQAASAGLFPGTQCDICFARRLHSARSLCSPPYAELRSELLRLYPRFSLGRVSDSNLASDHDAGD